MKTRLLAFGFTAALAVMSYFAFASAPPTRWVAIYGANYDGGKLYYDPDSRRTEVIGKDTVNFVSIMIVSSKTIDVKLRESSFKYRSFVKMLVSDCDTGLTSPVFDFYYSQEIPKLTDVPVKTVEYPLPTPAIAKILPKTSYIYQTVCPTYI
jgi:hypothetical protein